MKKYYNLKDLSRYKYNFFIGARKRRTNYYINELVKKRK